MNEIRYVTGLVMLVPRHLTFSVTTLRFLSTSTAAATTRASAANVALLYFCIFRRYTPVYMIHPFSDFPLNACDITHGVR